MAYSFIAAFVIFLLSFKFIPRVALWSRLVLTQRESREEGFGISSSKTERYLGIKGKTLTNLRPSGRALFGEEIVDVVTEGGFIEKDRNIKVVKVEGNKIIVSEET